MFSGCAVAEKGRTSMEVGEIEKLNVCEECRMELKAMLGVGKSNSIE